MPLLSLLDVPGSIDGVAVDGLVFVDGVDKLPAAVAGVRTLAASTVLLGTSSETAILKSTGLDADTPLLTMESGGPNPIQNR